MKKFYLVIFILLMSFHANGDELTQTSTVENKNLFNSYTTSEFFSAYEDKLDMFLDFELNGFKYSLISSENLSFAKEIFLDPERTAKFWSLPFDDEIKLEFIQEALNCSTLYRNKQQEKVLPHILMWVVRNSENNIIGIVGINAFKQDWADVAKGGDNNEIIKRLKNIPSYEILLIVKRGFEGKGYGSKIFKDTSNFILNHTNVQEILFIVSADNERSIKAGQKAGFKFYSPMILQLSPKTEEKERLLYIKSLTD